MRRMFYDYGPRRYRDQEEPDANSMAALMARIDKIEQALALLAGGDNPIGQDPYEQYEQADPDEEQGDECLEIQRLNAVSRDSRRTADRAMPTRQVIRSINARNRQHYKVN